tara:strand:+ start:15891 stop:16151 length:261 start_codon:yes stop_codon:yes gene_type:complete
MAGAPAKHKEWLNRVAEYLEKEDREVVACDLPNIIRRKNGRPFRNKPSRHAVFKRLQADGRFQLSAIGKGGGRRAIVRIKKKEDEC